jgi:AraC-like DNA-binding protein
MHAFASTLYTAAFALCAFAAGLLCTQRRRAGQGFAYFGVYLAIEALGFGLELMMHHPATPMKSLWLALRMSSALLIAPCLWLAVREIVEGERPSLASLHRGHFLVIAIGVVLTLPLLQTTHLGLSYASAAHVPDPLHDRFVHGTMLLCLALFAVQVPYYLWCCRQLLVRKFHAGNGALAASAPFAWLHLPLTIVFTTWLVGLFRTIYGAFGATTPGHVVLFALIQAGVTVAVIYLIVRREAGFEDQVAPAAPDVTEPSAAEPAAPRARYSRTELDPALRERIRRKIEAALQNETVYADSLISLRNLSGAIKEKTHYVSQVINQDLGTSFYELINHRRIDRAKTLLTDSPKQSVIEIALAVGFNSKSTFNAAFRRQVGMTPTEYRAAHITPP